MVRTNIMRLYMWIPALFAVTCVSFLSLIGAAFLLFQRPILTRIMPTLLAFSSGVLLGSAFFDLIPESTELLSDHSYLFVVAGIVSFFALEKLMQWHHHTDGDHPEDTKTPGYLSLIGDAIHNFVDGVIIGGAFLASPALGVTATIAVIAHEIPHELADFTILLHSGFSNTKALWYNFLSAATAILGTLLVLSVSTAAHSIIPYLIPFGAGNFLYIAMSDLIPQLHQKGSWRSTLTHIVVLILGATVIYFLASE